MENQNKKQIVPISKKALKLLENQMRSNNVSADSLVRSLLMGVHTVKKNCNKTTIKDKFPLNGCAHLPRIKRITIEVEVA